MAVSSEPAPKSTGARSPESDISAEPEVLQELKGELVTAGLRPDKAESVAHRVAMMVRVHSGPLPPVEDFAGYEQISEGAASTILRMAETQQRHRNFVEKAEILGEIGLKVLGILASVAIVGGMLAGAAYCASKGETAPAVALGSGAGITSVCGIFLRNFLRNAPDGPNAPPPPARKKQPRRRR